LEVLRIYFESKTSRLDYRYLVFYVPHFEPISSSSSVKNITDCFTLTHDATAEIELGLNLRFEL
jgi:hypothetical protein